MKAYQLAAFAAFISLSALNAAPTILEQPQSATITSGGRGWVTCLVKGTGPFQFVWQKDGQTVQASASVLVYSFQWDRPGLGSDTQGVLFFPSETSALAGDYQVTVTDVGAGAAIASTAATLSMPTVDNEPAHFVTTLPSTLTAKVGDTVTLSAPFQGTNVSSMWCHYDSSVGMQNLTTTGSSLTLTNIQANQGGYYILRIANQYPAPYGSRATTYVYITVTP